MQGYVCAVSPREKCRLRRSTLFLWAKLEFPLRLKSAVWVKLSGVLRWDARMEKQRMKRQVLKALLGGLFLVAGVAHAQDVVRIGTLSDYPPFEYKDASGQLKGMEIELGNAMCKHMQAQCEYVTMDFDALIPALKAKKIDAVLAQMSITDERKKVVDFTDLFTLAPVQYVAKVGSGISEYPPRSAIARLTSDCGSFTSPNSRAPVGQAFTQAGLRSAGGSSSS